jgi:hypothetical protein
MEISIQEVRERATKRERESNRRAGKTERQ